MPCYQGHADFPAPPAYHLIAGQPSPGMPPQIRLHSNDDDILSLSMARRAQLSMAAARDA